MTPWQVTNDAPKQWGFLNNTPQLGLKKIYTSYDMNPPNGHEPTVPVWLIGDSEVT